MIGQFDFGMHRQVPRLEALSKGTLLQSHQSCFHQMEDILCQVQMIGQSEFGMHRQVAR